MSKVGLCLAAKTEIEADERTATGICRVVCSSTWGEVEKEDMPGVSITIKGMGSWDGRIRNKPRWLLVLSLAGRGSDGN